MDPLRRLLCCAALLPLSGIALASPTAGTPGEAALQGTLQVMDVPVTRAKADKK